MWSDERVMSKPTRNDGAVRLAHDDQALAPVHTGQLRHQAVGSAGMTSAIQDHGSISLNLNLHQYSHYRVGFGVANGSA